MKKKLLMIMTIAALAAALTACQKAPAESTDSGQTEAPSTQQPADEGGAEDQNNEEVVLSEKIYGDAAFIIALDPNQWYDAEISDYGKYSYIGQGEEVETIMMQDCNWAEGITDVEDVPAIVDERIDERLLEYKAHQSYNRTEDSREKVTVNGFDMLRVTGTITLDSSNDGTWLTECDYIGYFFLANSSVSISKNCPSYLIALAKKTDAEDESYVYDQAVAEKNLALIDDIIQTYREI